MVEKDASSSKIRERVVVVEQDFANSSAEVRRLTAHHKTYKDLLECVCKAPALPKITSQRPTSAHTKDSERSLADQVVVESEFCKLREDMQANIDRIQKFLDG